MNNIFVAATGILLDCRHKESFSSKAWIDHLLTQKKEKQANNIIHIHYLHSTLRPRTKYPYGQSIASEVNCVFVLQGNRFPLFIMSKGTDLRHCTTCRSR